MDRMSTSVSNRRLRRAQPSKSENIPLDLDDVDSKGSSSGWNRIYVLPIQARSLYSGVRTPVGRFRLLLKWLGVLYVAFCVLTFRPVKTFNSLALWAKSSPTLARAFPRFYKPPLGIMPASLLFSKLAPQLGNLAPDAIQVVLNNPPKDNGSNLTCCIWIPDTYPSALDNWTGASSVLMTTPHEAGSPPHKQLTKQLQKILKKRRRPRTTIILISTPFLLPNSNTYINLARLFANTPWTLLVPPLERPTLPAKGFPEVVSKLELRTQTVDSNALFDGQVPDTLIVPLDSPTWCPEQDFAASKGTKPGDEWSTCIHDFLKN